MIGRFVSASLKRDAAEFTAFSPTFNDVYIAAFDSKIASVIDLIEPQSETIERKQITERIYETMGGLIDPINRITGYMTLAKDLKVSPADIGLTSLRKAINAGDVEKVLDGLHLVTVNVNKYKEPLIALGLTESLITRFTNASTSIADDKQKQNEILSNRRSIVQNNVNQLNDLWNTLSEILSIGKILYKASDAAKLQDYTFSSLKKQVNGASRSAGSVSAKPASTEKESKGKAE